MKMLFSFSIFYALLMWTGTVVTSEEIDSTIGELRRNLLKGYDKNARPVYHNDNTTVVEVTMAPRQIIEMDEKKGVFVVDAIIKMMWIDEYLKWDPGDYNGLQRVHFADHEIWQPDLAFYNAEGCTVDPFQKTLCIVNNKGQVIRVPPAHLRLICPLDYKDYPNDVQSCDAKLLSWSTDGNIVELKLGPQVSSTTNSTESVDFTDSNPFWKLERFEASSHRQTFACCEEPYFHITFTFVLRRKGSITQHACKLLQIIAHVLLLCMFWLPSDSLGKILLGLTAITCQGVTLLIVGRSVASPAFAEIAFSFLQLEFAASLAAIISEVIVINLAKAGLRNLFSPNCFNMLTSSKVLTGIFCLCLTSRNDIKFRDNEAPAVTARTSDIQQDAQSVNKKKFWLSVATIADRILFVVFVIVFLCLGKHW